MCAKRGIFIRFYQMQSSIVQKFYKNITQIV